MSRARTDAIKLKQITSGEYIWNNTQTFTRVKEVVVRENAAGTYTVDLTKGVIFNLTLAGNTTFVFPPVEEGAQFTLNLKQDATGNRSVSWPFLVRWGNDVPPALSSLGLRTDTVSFISDGNVWMGYEGGKKFNATLGPVTWAFTYSSLWAASGVPTQAKLEDGVSSSYWGSEGSDLNPFLRADFGAPIVLSYVRYMPAAASESWGSTYTNGALLQYSLNGTTWVTLTTINDAVDEVITTFILPTVVSARYVRLYKSGTAFLGVGEFSFG